MTTITDHTPDTEGMFTMQAGASMFATAAAVLSAPAGEATLTERNCFHTVLCEMLDAARAGGFPDDLSDELDAHVLAGRINGRSVALAHEAARCTRPSRFLAIAARHGI